MITNEPYGHPTGEVQPVCALPEADGISAAEQFALQREQRIGELYSTVRLDLFLSFMMSQADEDKHFLWLECASVYYAATLTEDDKRLLPTVGDRLLATLRLVPDRHTGKRLPEMRAPRDHDTRQLGSFYNQEQFRDYGKELIAYLSEAETEDGRDPQRIWSDSELIALATNLVDRDITYQGKNRKRGLVISPDDTHASLFKLFVIDGMSSGSEAFDAAVAGIRTMLATDRNPEDPCRFRFNELLDDIENLSQKWEANHPGERFNPSETSEPDKLAAALGHAAHLAA